MVGIAAISIVVGGLWLWLRSGAVRETASSIVRAHRSGRVVLDVEAFRIARNQQMQRASDLALAHAKRAGSGSRALRGNGLTNPCVLGPAELCGLLTDMIADCESGDASSCLAVGQMLSDTPPRPLFALIFFVKACRAGDRTGCERVEFLKNGSGVVDCTNDPYACAWRAYRADDEPGLDEACTNGVADACAAMTSKYEDEPETARPYLERACQLGNPMTCEELGRRLSIGCVATPAGPCYPADPAQARASLEIACAAGWTKACRTTAKPL